MKQKLFLTFCLILVMASAKAQGNYVNRTYQNSTGNPVFNPILNPLGQNYSKSLVLPSGDVVMVGYTTGSGGGQDVLLVKRNYAGTILFSTTFNTSGSNNDYGIGLSEASNGDYLVCGTTDNGGTTNYDVLILRYSSSGTLLYSATKNATAGKNDVAVDIKELSSGDIAILANTEATNSFSDFWLLKYTSTLGFSNAVIYDYVGFNDIAIGISQIVSGKITIVGASASSSVALDYTQVVYTETTLAYVTQTRSSLPGTSVDQALATCRDASNNTYITGRFWNGSNFDIKTIKINSSYSIAWTHTLNPNGMDDAGSAITLDPLTNDVIVGGYATKTNGYKEIICLRLSNSTGTLIGGLQNQSAENTSGDAYIKQVCTNASGDVYFVGGEKGNSGYKQVIVGKIRANGTGAWQRKIANSANDMLPSDIVAFSPSGVGVISINDPLGTSSYVSTGYDDKEFTVTTATNSAGSNYNLNNIIIAFNKTALKMSVINNKYKEFGVLGDFVDSSTCNKIDNRIGTKFKSATFPTRKIFLDMTEADSLTTSRQGDVVKVPYFYTNLLVKLPTGYNVKLAVDSLKFIKPNINFAEYNFLYEPFFTPNDPYYASSQGALHPTTTYTAADINCAKAWDYSKGQPYVKVGIIDSGIDYTNPDLVGTVAGGYDQFLNATYTNVDNIGHGTACAGIIGAKTNNSIGGAGIAGGDVAISQAGVSLYNYRIMSYYYFTNSDAGAAIVRGAGTDFVNVLNNSYGSNTSTDVFLEKGVSFANRCGVAFVAAKGNSGNTNIIVPACLKEQMVMCVGASGTDGNYKSFSNGDVYTTNYGYPMDYIAPGTSQLISTTGTSANTVTFTGTSAAAPHVAGIAALLMSYRNHPTPHWDNLTGEDCDNIIKKSCKDKINLPTDIGYDQLTGYGLVDAGKALDTVAYPKFDIKHIDASHNTTSFAKVTNTVLSNQLIKFQGDSLMAQGNYYANVYEILTTLNYNLNTTENVISAWPMNKASFGCGFYTDSISTDEPWFCEIVSYNNTQAVLRTYQTLLKTTSTSTVPINYLFPPATTLINSAITLQTYDPNGAVKVIENLPLINMLNIYPNPAKGSFNVGINSNFNSTNTSLIVNDIIGNVCYQKNINITQGINQFVVDAKHLQTGVYFVTFTLDGKNVTTKKLIIN